MAHRSLLVLSAVLTLVVGGLLAPSARAHHASISGFVTDASTGAPLADVCVTLGPPITCFTRTDASGMYFIDLAALAASDGSTWDLYFLKQPQYQTVYSEIFKVDGPVTFNQPLMPIGRAAACGPVVPGVPTQTAYLPNVTKTLGGGDGWQTPFIVQNTGTAPTTLEITFFRFLNGQCVARRVVGDVRPGTSFADVPNNDPDLPGDTQFAVVVRSFGAPVVAIVNQHAGSGSRAEALAYVGATRGSTSVFLPNITRRFFGYVTPFIIQNLGTASTTAVARFVSFDGTAPAVSVSRVIEAGKSRFIDPNSEPGLFDGKQYAVTVAATQPLAVVVNTHNDAPWVGAPVAYSTNGIAGGAATLYGAYAAKNAGNDGRVTTIVVQNLGSAELRPSLAFLRLGQTGAPQQLVSPSPVPPGGAWAFDPRFTLGTTTPCAQASPTCLGDGEYSFVAQAGTEDGLIAVAVNVISASTAMGYTATDAAAARFFLPNVTRTLCACPDPSFLKGWTTPIVLQGIGASAATLRWYRFRDGMLVHTQRIELPSGSALPVDPRFVPALSDDTQYAVVVEGIGGTVNAIVLEFAPGADNAMIYEGFPDRDAPPAAGPAAVPTPQPTRSPLPTPTGTALPTVVPVPTSTPGR